MNERNENSLTTASVKYLYDGMVVQDDIYDADERLLVKSGNVLTAVQLERIKNLNSGRDTIYVTSRTRKAMMSKRPNIDIDSRLEVEKATGYTEAKDETFELLDKITNEKVLQQEALQSLSDDLSNRLEQTSPATIMSLINAPAPADEYLQRHSMNVSLLNGLFGKWTELRKSDIDLLVLIGLLHDCGKTLLPSMVLNAPRKLTLTEFEVVKMHAVYSFDLLAEFPESVRRAARLHHERLNGTGYPDRLYSDDIPLEARITAVSDIYDAMVSQRSYREPQSPFAVLKHLTDLSGAELDDKIVRIFVDKLPKELINKPVTMSDGTIGIIREFDPEDILYPMVEVSGRVIRSNENLHCVSMYCDE